MGSVCINNGVGIHDVFLVKIFGPRAQKKKHNCTFIIGIRTLYKKVHNFMITVLTLFSIIRNVHCIISQNA